MWGRNGGGSKVSPTPGFFVSNTRWLLGNFATTDFRRIWPWDVNRSWNADFGQKFWKVSIQGSFAPKTPNFEGVKHLHHSEQATDQGMHCTDILFTPRCSPRAREFGGRVNFFVRRTVAELRGVKFAQFLGFGFFSPYKTPNP